MVDNKFQVQIMNISKIKLKIKDSINHPPQHRGSSQGEGVKSNITQTRILKFLNVIEFVRFVQIV